MDIYKELKQRGLTKNKTDFSTKWCNMSESYCSKYRKVGIKAQFNIWQMLNAMGEHDLAVEVFQNIFNEIKKPQKTQ